LWLLLQTLVAGSLRGLHLPPGAIARIPFRRSVTVYADITVSLPGMTAGVVMGEAEMMETA